MPTSEPKSSTQDVLRANHDPATQGDAKSGRGNKQKAILPNREDSLLARFGQRKDSVSRRTDTSGNVLLEPMARRDYDLSYACLLIPRVESHLLTGKVTDFLHATIAQICKFFGWRLDFVQVRPEYLQWVVSAPAATPPSRCIRTIREQTSKGILDKFHQFRDKNPFQDFWAPGYLVLVGPAAHPPDVINEFIRLTRQQQEQQGLRPRGT